MSDFEKNNEDTPKRTPSRKKLVDLKALALLEEPEDMAENNVSPIRKKDNVSFHPNEELIQTTSRIKNQRDLIRSRMTKMEQSKTRVSKNVFEKVYRDYSMQLESITHLLNEKKGILKKELKNLYLAFEKKTLDVNRHREILEEAQFRHYLEEFSEEQYKEVEDFESREIGGLQTELAQIQSFIRLHEELFDPQDLGLPPPQEKPAADVTKTILPPIQPQQPPQEAPIQRPVVQQAQTVIQQSPKAEFREPSLSRNPEAASHASADHRSPEPEDFVPQAESRVSQAPQIEEPAQEDLLDEDDLLEEPALEQQEADQAQAAEATPGEASDENEIQEVAQPVIEEPASVEASQPAYFEASNPSMKVESSISQKIDVQGTDSKIEQAPAATADNTDKGSAESQSIMDILGDIALDEEVSETHSHVSSVSSYSVPTGGSQASQAGEFKLVFIEADGPLDVNEFVVRDNVSIGRSPSNDLVLKAPKVSRQHAAINKYKDQYLLIDLKSSNGVFVNGKKIEEHSLQEGDEVSIGGYKMIFKKS